MDSNYASCLFEHIPFIHNTILFFRRIYNTIFSNIDNKCGHEQWMILFIIYPCIEEAIQIQWSGQHFNKNNARIKWWISSYPKKKKKLK